jgi:hypothetical protein
MLGALSLLAFFAVVFGNPNPLAAYGRQRIFLEGIPLGLAGLLFDQEFGLLPVSPFYVVAFAALGTQLRREMRPALLILGVLGAVALPGAAHPLWTGGTSAPARFLFPALPLLAAAAAAFTCFEPRRGMAVWTRPLLIAGLSLGAFMAFGPGQPLYLNQRDGTGRLWESLGSSWDLTHYLPSITRADSRSLAMAIAGMLVLSVIVLLHWSRRRFSLPPVIALAFLTVFLVDWALPGWVASGSGTRWMTTLLRQLSQRENDRFLLLPSAESLAGPEVRERIDIPLFFVENRETGDWRSPAFHLPAGVYRLEGHSPELLRLCNGQGCLSSAGIEGGFATRVALAHFHIRSKTPRAQLRLRARRLSLSPIVADRSLRLDHGVDVHALDDHAYLDPKGFWIRGGEKAEFALETSGGSPGQIVLANGGRENWVVVEYHGQANQFLLRPWARRTLGLPMNGEVLLLSVTSRSGFRPSELDSSSNDGRMLGVLLTSG